MTTTGVVVVDSSLALKWVLPEDKSTEARDLLAEWARSQVQPIVPSWFSCEIANVLYQFVKQGSLTVAVAQQFHRVIMSQVKVAPDEPALGERAIELAHAIRHRGSYDTQYLALAEWANCELWTADDKFWRALQVIPEGVRVRSLYQI
jgi:predicted nucleic acid-binding protein